MPRISVYLRDLDRAAKIHAQAAALGTGVEKEICSWLIFLVGKQTVRESARVRTRSIHLTLDDRQFCLCSGIVLSGRWYRLKLETAGCRGAGIVINRYFYLGFRGKLQH